MANRITLYDIDNKSKSNWSPNTFKPRPVLGVKGIEYDTKWISYADIENQIRPHCQEKAKTVTLPVLQDGQKYIADSWDIAKYLESKYPTPTIFPGGIEANEKFHGYVCSTLYKPVLMWILPQVPPILDDRGAEYFIRTREASFGKPLNEVAQGGDDEFLPQIRGGMTPVFHALKASGAYILGKEFGYADISVLSVCAWIKACDADKFKKFLALDADGNLAKWYERCQTHCKDMRLD